MDVTSVNPTPEEFKPLHIIIDNEAEEIEGYYNLHITKDQIELPNTLKRKDEYMYSCVVCPNCLIPLEYDGNKEPKYDIYTCPKCGYRTKSQKPKMYFKTERGWELVRAWPYQDEQEEILRESHMSIEEMIKWIDEYRKTVNDEEANTRLSMIGIFLVKLKDLCVKE